MASRKTVRAAAAQPSPVTTPQAQSTAAAMEPCPFALAVSLVLAASLVVTAGWSSAAHAQAAERQTGSATAAQAQAGDVRQYDIPAGPLSEVLTRFSTASGIFLGGATDLAEGKTSPGLQGQYSVEQALRTLLADSGLSYRFAGETRVTLEAAQEADGPILTGPITVEGQGESPYRPVDGYKADRSITGTKTNTPLIKTPQAVSVVTRDRLDDQNVRSLPDAIRNVPGVNVINTGGFDADFYDIRGFRSSNNTYLDGLKSDPSLFVEQETFGLQRVEVLRGPASVLYGQNAPGGIVNLITKRPLSAPHAEVGVSTDTFGSFEFNADGGGPLFESDRARIRLSALFSDKQDFTDFVQKKRVFVQPTLEVDLPPDTTLTLIASYQQDVDFIKNQGLPAQGTVLPNPNGSIPLDRFTGEPDFNDFTIEQSRLGYELDHSISDGWSIRHNVRGQVYDFAGQTIFNAGFAGNQRDLNRAPSFQDVDNVSVASDLQVEGNASTGSIEHHLLLGTDYYYRDLRRQFGGGTVAALDVFAPAYGSSVTRGTTFLDSDSLQNDLGFYGQDQIDLSERLSVVLGGRYDIAWLDTTNNLTGAETSKRDDAFTGRAGILYEVVPGVVPYFSYAESFVPVSGTDAQGQPFEPETGTQFEVGVKTEFLDGKVGWNIALFDLTRQNVTTTDPNNTNFSIQTGEQRSRGVETELLVNLDQWEAVASYAFMEAEITKDNTFSEGNGLRSIPRHSASLWGKYKFSGLLSGLSIGSGVRFVGEREGDLANTFTLPDYTVVDAGVFYETESLDASLNVSNLFDKDYFIGSFSRNQVHIGEPLTVRASVSIKF